jgi:hypothetical protein
MRSMRSCFFPDSLSIVRHSSLKPKMISLSRSTVLNGTLTLRPYTITVRDERDTRRGGEVPTSKSAQGSTADMARANGLANGPRINQVISREQDCGPARAQAHTHLGTPGHWKQQPTLPIVFFPPSTPSHPRSRLSGRHPVVNGRPLTGLGWTRGRGSGSHLTRAFAGSKPLHRSQLLTASAHTGAQTLILGDG